MGVMDLFFEREPEENKPAVAATTPAVAVPTAATPKPSAPAATTEVTPTEAQEAQARVYGFAGYAALPNLQKFVAMDTKLAAKITDPEARESAVIDALDVVGITAASVAADAAKAVIACRSGVQTFQAAAQGGLTALAAQETEDRKNLENAIAEDERVIAAATARRERTQAELAGLASKFASERSRSERTVSIVLAVSEQTIPAWERLSQRK